MEGCSLSGGHTCEGAELALGFSISSYCPDISLLLRKSGGQCGDQIVLTKPLGTGCIFAANMRAKCKGNWVADAIRLMTSSNGPASRIAVDIIRGRKGMTDSGIHACTDVTGFGLIGHLLEMLLSNDSVQGCDSIGATLHLNAIPFLEGALDAVSNQIFSSLYKDNVRTRRAIRNHEATMESSPIKYPILFDPQTAGGLLFFVSPDVCHVFLRRLSEIPGCEYTSVIGEVNPFSDNSHTESMFALDSCGKRSGERIVVLP
jgi:selenide,water dikinase